MLSSITYKNFYKESIENVPGDFWGNEGAGALFVARDTGRILLFLRSNQVEESGTWNLTGGRIDDGEGPKEAVAREIEEESGYRGTYNMALLYTFRHRDFKYHNYLALIPNEFTPALNWEHTTSKWVEFGDWPSPLHFGLNYLIKHAGDKIKRVVDTIKKKLHNNKNIEPINTSESMDATPPPSIQAVPAHDLSSGLIDYIKSVENSERVGFDKNTQLWLPHKSSEGGLATIAYGHKLKPDEIVKFKKGITDRDANELLNKDLKISKDLVIKYHEKWVTNYISEIRKTLKPETPNYNFYMNLNPTDPVFKITTKQLEMLIDYAFNLGSLNKFPKFVDAVIRKDWAMAELEYKRKYKDSHGTTYELTKRNQLFHDKYLTKNI